MDEGHIWYALAWASFGVLHSVLASQRAKSFAAPVVRGGYRIAYNLIAVLHVGIVLWLGRAWLDGGALGLPSGLRLAGDALTLAGLVLILAAFARYDGRQFAGIAQLGADGGDAVEPLRTDGLNRYVRHPAYSGAFLALWGHAQTEFALATAVWASLYLAIGSRYEERRLIDLYGEVYRDYRRRVPAFVPWRGRATG